MLRLITRPALRPRTQTTRPPVHLAVMGDTSLFSRANSTAPPTPSWRPSPNTRGTRDIVSTCLATLLICVWKAVHTDIPLDQSQSNFTDKLGWLVIGIFAPDVLLYTACCQLERALRYRDYAGKYLDCPPEPPGWPSHLRIRASRLLEYIGSRLKVRDLWRHTCP